MRARLAAGLLVLSLGVAGCSDDEPTAGPTLPPATPAPSPTAEAVPSEATEATPEGAAEFARLFYAEVARGFQTADPGPVERLVSESCQVCQNYIGSIQAVRDQGWRAEGGDFDIAFAVAPALQGDIAKVDVGWDFSPVTYLDNSGAVADSGPAVTGVERAAHVDNGRRRLASDRGTSDKAAVMKALVLASGLVLGLSTPALALDVPSAAPSPAPPKICNPCSSVDAAPSGDGIRATVTRGVSDKVPGRGTPATHGDAPGRRTWLTTDEYVTPACPGNTFEGFEALCTFALVSCPADDQLRYWIWHTTLTFTRNDDGSVTQTPAVGVPVQLPGSYCLGPDDPGVPTIGQVLAQVQTGFRDLPLPVAEMQVDPAPTSLVNIPTAFFAGGATTATFSPTILGTTVTINARATQWDWTWGDGQTSTTSTPGVPKRPVVSHEYVRAQDVAVGVSTTWTGTFTIPGSDEVFAIRTPAVVQSEPVTVQVREARTQLVDR